jgi:hypothetical protein
MKEKSSHAHKLEKRRMLVRLKKFMFRNRILSYSQEYNRQSTERLKNFAKRLPHLNEKWD